MDADAALRDVLPVLGLRRRLRGCRLGRLVALAQRPAQPGGTCRGRRGGPGDSAEERRGSILFFAIVVAGMERR